MHGTRPARRAMTGTRPCTGLASSTTGTPHDGRSSAPCTTGTPHDGHSHAPGPFGTGDGDRRFSRAPIPVNDDRNAMVTVPHERRGSPVFPRSDTHRCRSEHDRPATALRIESGPTPRFSGAAGKFVDRGEYEYETALIKNRQLTGRASGVRCERMLGGKIDRKTVFAASQWHKTRLLVNH